MMIQKKKLEDAKEKAINSLFEKYYNSLNSFIVFSIFSMISQKLYREFGFESPKKMSEFIIKEWVDLAKKISSVEISASKDILDITSTLLGSDYFAVEDLQKIHNDAIVKVKEACYNSLGIK